MKNKINSTGSRVRAMALAAFAAKASRSNVFSWYWNWSATNYSANAWRYYL